MYQSLYQIWIQWRFKFRQIVSVKYDRSCFLCLAHQLFFHYKGAFADYHNQSLCFYLLPPRPMACLHLNHFTFVPVFLAIVVQC